MAISQDDLRKILADHALWLNGTGGKVANLQKANLREADLRGANLQEADLRGADLQRANLQRANLQGADLRGADLRGANLRGADLQRANLQEANLQRANLQGADLRGANLQGADLQRANLQRANLQEADLRGADLRGAVGLYRFLAIGPAGSRRDYTTVIVREKGGIEEIYTGCFCGDLTAFRKAVEKTHKQYPVELAEYRVVIRAIEMWLALDTL